MDELSTGSAFCQMSEGTVEVNDRAEYFMIVVYESQLLTHIDETKFEHISSKILLQTTVMVGRAVDRDI